MPLHTHQLRKSCSHSYLQTEGLEVMASSCQGRFMLGVRKHASRRVVMQWHSCPGRRWSHRPWRCSRTMEMWHWGMWFSGEILVVGGIPVHVEWLLWDHTQLLLPGSLESHVSTYRASTSRFGIGINALLTRGSSLLNMNTPASNWNKMWWAQTARVPVQSTGRGSQSFPNYKYHCRGPVLKITSFCIVQELRQDHFWAAHPFNGTQCH